MPGGENNCGKSLSLCSPSKRSWPTSLPEAIFSFPRVNMHLLRQGIDHLPYLVKWLLCAASFSVHEPGWSSFHTGETQTQVGKYCRCQVLRRFRPCTALMLITTGCLSPEQNDIPLGVRKELSMTHQCKMQTSPHQWTISERLLPNTRKGFISETKNVLQKLHFWKQQKERSETETWPLCWIEWPAI